MADEIIKTEGEVVIPPKLEPSDEIPGVVPDEHVEPPAQLPEQPPEPVVDTPDEPYAKFDTQEDLEAFLASQKQTEIDKLPVDENGDTIFPPDWKPTDWNNAFEEYEKRREAREENKKKIQAEQQKRLEQEFDNQYNAAAKKYNLPALSTPEGQDVNKQITTIGAKFNQSSITDSVELWRMIPKSQGGGLDYTPEKPVNPNKAASALIGGSTGGTPSKPSINYEKLHKTDLDTLIQEKLGNE